MRKGQLTIIIIVGIALLLAVGIFLMQSPKKQAPSLAATQDMSRVTDFVQNCLAQSGKQSLKDIGLQGGYYTITLKNQQGPDSQITTIPPQKIPLWHEVQACQESNVGCVKDHHPSLCAKSESSCPVQDNGAEPGVSFQEGIEKGIADKIDLCLGNFTQFPDIDIARKGAPKARALIRENDIKLTLDYPLEITTNDKQRVELNNYAAQLDISLPQVYRFARDLQVLERNYGFLDQAFLHLLDIYAGMTQPFPPFREIQTSGSMRTWSRTNVQHLMEQDLLPFMDFVQIINAQESYVPMESPNSTNETAPYANGIYKYLEIHMDNDTMYPLGVRFEYPRTPIFLDINSGAEYLRPREMPDMGGMLSFIGLNLYDYRFHYAVAFPMVVHVKDPYAFNGEGFELTYGMEVNIRNNAPVNTTVPLIAGSFGPTSLDLLSPEQLVNHTYRVKATDQHTKQSLSDARVTYVCGTEFYLGQTDSNGLWSGRAPYCLAGGYFDVKMAGYAGTAVAQNNANDDNLISPAITISLWPIRAKPVRLFKLTADDVKNISGGYDPSLARTRLTPNDMSIITLMRVKPSPYDDDVPLAPVLQFGTAAANANKVQNIQEVRDELKKNFVAGVITKAQLDEMLSGLDDAKDLATSDNNIPLDDTKIVDIVPGKYTLSGQLMYSGFFTVPTQKERDYTLDARNFTNWVSGGIKHDGPNAVVFSEDDVYGDNNLTLYVLEVTFVNDLPMICKADNSTCVPVDASKDLICRNASATDCAPDTGNYSSMMRAAYARNATAYRAVTLAFKTPYPMFWSDVLGYKTIDEYQKYGRREMARPVFEEG